MLIAYIIFTCICAIICSWLYIRLKYKFWVKQPVFHFYDFHYWLKNVGIINRALPQTNRYTNFVDIKTVKTDDLTSNQISMFVAFIHLNYLRNHENVFEPQKDNILPYFSGTTQPCFWSLYFQNTYYSNHTSNKTIYATTPIKDKKLIGAITSRPLHMSIKNNPMIVYYVDYLCVHKNNRKQGIAPQLIQTHEYCQSHLNKQISVSIFKREDELTGLIPMTTFNSYCFDATRWKQKPPKLLFLKIVIGSSSNMYYFSQFVTLIHNERFTNEKCKNVLVIPDVGNMIELVKSNNLHVIMLLMGVDIVGAFVFRKTCTFLKKNMEILSCICSVKSNHITSEQFLRGFKNSVWNLLHKQNCNYTYVMVENVADNDIIIDYLKEQYNPILTSPNAYYFYNFAHEPFKSKNVIMIN